MAIGEEQALDELIQIRGSEAIGSEIWERFGELPFLLKILAAAGPLSIQAHPSLDQARAGFKREDEAGIDRAAPDRNYRDDNHKPELICAITPFEAKCGFRPIDETSQLLGLFTGLGIDELRKLLVGEDDAKALAGAVQWLLRLPEVEATALSNDVTEQAKQLHVRSDGSSPFATEIEWTVKIGTDFPGDIGVVVALLLNHVSLMPGQAMFLEAGNMHSYLEGVGIELMANSDNVLRGGLTSKHVDVAELLDVVQYAPGKAPVQTPSGPIHRFESPVPEFSLTRLDSFEVAQFSPPGPSILLVTSGGVSVNASAGSLDLKGGDAAFLSASDGAFQVSDSRPGVTVAWVARVGSG